ncbi:Ribosomal protein [Aspergillus sp. HF37]|nr:Ribosomal protein [Aspergillus sp. HF37]
MGAVYPYGTLVRSARPGVTFVPRRTLTYTPIRRAQEDNNGKPEEESKPSTLSSIKNFFLGTRTDSEKPKLRRPSAPQKREGSLSADSIFADDEAAPKPKTAGLPAEPAEGAEDADFSIERRNPEYMRAELDPRPQARMRWERKMITRDIRNRGRIPRAVQIMRTERESLSTSQWFKTSIKKLAPLARQIAGKNIDEAIIQMRFSNKKAAKDVLGHLNHAKNVATARNGLGLTAPDDQELKRTPPTVTLKSGERKKITDPSGIYIAQAWVNRGPYGMDYDHRARGQVFMLRPPHTGLSVLLKEERSRIREWRDRQDKALRQRKSQLWTHLPDRKIYGQNQYYSW